MHTTLQIEKRRWKSQQNLFSHQVECAWHSALASLGYQGVQNLSTKTRWSVKKRCFMHTEEGKVSLVDLLGNQKAIEHFGAMPKVHLYLNQDTCGGLNDVVACASGERLSRALAHLQTHRHRRTAGGHGANCSRFIRHSNDQDGRSENQVMHDKSTLPGVPPRC